MPSTLKTGINMNRFLKWLDKNGRKKTIMDRISNQPYMERYYIFLKDRKRFPFNIFLHKFLKGDPDDLHDHPWPYATLIIKGGYWEYTPGGKVWRAPGHFRISKATSLHRIELEPGVACWSIFMPGIQQRTWGFIYNDKWVQFEKYLRDRYDEADIHTE